ncbi:MAG: glutamate-cysteine ligase family protein [Nocardioidaceae bacterium]
MSEQILAARGEDISISIDGVDRLHTTADTIVPEAACTSTQLHLQVGPDEFADYWNASQAIAGVQLALGANSPFLLGKQLWHETRIALFEQATDTRGEELKAQGVRPRVWFGERWITSIFDLFEENVRYFPALLPIFDDEDPDVVLEAGQTPKLGELRLHNGTIYRWNRPIYDVVEESRTCGSRTACCRQARQLSTRWPTLPSTSVWRAPSSTHDRPLWSQMSFSAAEENFHMGAQHGIEAQVYWPGLGRVPASELVLRRLLPLAYRGLDAHGVEPGERDRLLGIIEQRCVTGRNGAVWMIDSYRAAYDAGARDRFEALRQVTRDYEAHMHTNEPVHTWS